ATGAIPGEPSRRSSRRARGTGGVAEVEKRLDRRLASFRVAPRPSRETLHVDQFSAEGTREPPPVFQVEVEAFGREELLQAAGQAAALAVPVGEEDDAAASGRQALGGTRERLASVNGDDRPGETEAAERTAVPLALHDHDGSGNEAVDQELPPQLEELLEGGVVLPVVRHPVRSVSEGLTLRSALEAPHISYSPSAVPPFPMPDTFTMLLEWRRNEAAGRTLAKLPPDYYASTAQYLAELKRSYESDLR